MRLETSASNQNRPSLKPLASSLKRRKIAIVNADDPYHRLFLDAAPASSERLTYAIHNSADVRAYDKTHLQALHMADMLSDGLVSQFPARFR